MTALGLVAGEGSSVALPLRLTGAATRLRRGSGCRRM
jgi:hypothetical protein